jgi:hypothetical protein
MPYVGRVPRSAECHANADPPEWNRTYNPAR